MMPVVREHVSERGPRLSARERGSRGGENGTFQLLEDAVHGAGAAAAVHADVELVRMCVGHVGGERMDDAGRWCRARERAGH